MTLSEAINYLQPIADITRIDGYYAAMNVAVDAMRELEQLREELKDERYRHDRQADFTIGQGEKIDRLKAEIESLKTKLEAVKPSSNDPLTLDDLRRLAEDYEEYGSHIWVEEILDRDVMAAVTDFYNGEVVAIWGHGDLCLWKEKEYGKTWRAYRHKPEAVQK